MNSMPPPSGTARPSSGKPDTDERFVRYILQRCADSTRARSDLRSGLGRPVEDCHRMDAHLAWRLSEDMPQEVREARYMVAALIAARPRRARDRAGEAVQAADENGTARAHRPPTLGASLAQGVAEDVLKPGSAEAELSWMARQSLDALRPRLPSLILPLLAKGIAVDWGALLRDLKRWDDSTAEVGMRWLVDYHQARARALDPDAAPRECRPGEFVQCVLDLCAQSNAARADLRKGLALPVRRCFESHRHLVPLLPTSLHHDDLRAHYAVAALIANRDRAARAPEPAAATGRRRSDFGASLAQAVNKKILSADSAEQDLHVMARQGSAALHLRMPALTTQLLNKGVPVDWAVLLDDLAWWDRARDKVATRWLDNYFAVRTLEDRKNSRKEND